MQIEENHPLSTKFALNVATLRTYFLNRFMPIDMRTYYILLVAIFLPKLLLSTTPINYHLNYDLDDKLTVTKSHKLENKASSLSLPEIICPESIDTILPSRRECEAVLDYNVGFNTSNCPISDFNLSQNFSDDNILSLIHI